MPPRATVAAAAVFATRTTVAAVARRATAGGTAGAEVTKLTGQLCVERVVEADGHRSVTCSSRLALPGSRGSGGSPAIAVSCAVGERIPRRARGQADLALLVDLLDDHFDLLPERQHVFDVVDALALAELGDVDQPITAGEDVDERPELRDVDHPTDVGRTDIGLRGIDDREDPSLGLFHLRCLDGADGDDADRAVVVDCDVGARLLLNRVDDLALRPDHFADLVHRNGDRDDLRCGGSNLGTWLR